MDFNFIVSIKHIITFYDFSCSIQVSRMKSRVLKLNILVRGKKQDNLNGFDVVVFQIKNSSHDNSFVLC